MLMTRYLHSLVFVALLFAIIGQSFAAADLPCKIMMQHMPDGAHQHASLHDSSDESADVSHMMHGDMSSMVMGHSDGQDCCKTQCSCPPSGCVPFALALMGSELLLSDATYTQPSFPFSVFIDSPIQSLYKPPIFA